MISLDLVANNDMSALLEALGFHALDYAAADEAISKIRDAAAANDNEDETAARTRSTRKPVVSGVRPCRLGRYTDSELSQAEPLDGGDETAAITSSGSGRDSPPRGDFEDFSRASRRVSYESPMERVMEADWSTELPASKDTCREQAGNTGGHHERLADNRDHSIRLTHGLKIPHEQIQSSQAKSGDKENHRVGQGPSQVAFFIPSSLTYFAN